MAWALILVVLLAQLVGCQATPLTPTATPAVEPPAAAGASAAPVRSAAPLAPEQARPPVEVTFPSLDLTLPVEPMGWTVVEVNGQPTTEWQVPDAAVGWHVNTVGAGALGNLILSGHQALGEAVFAPLALGELALDQQVFVMDGEGRTFVYRIAEISDPIPLAGASADDQARAAAYMAPAEAAQLTLITGWPDYTTTHRVFARAEYVGLLE